MNDWRNIEHHFTQSNRSRCSRNIRYADNLFQATFGEIYQDYETNPGNERFEQVVERIKQSFTDYFIVKADRKSVGAIRILKMKNGNRCRISPIFILPDYQNKRITQSVFKMIEELYKPELGWELDTILEEKGNCYLYEKMGYKKTGETKRINDKLTLVYYEKEGTTE